MVKEEERWRAQMLKARAMHQEEEGTLASQTLGPWPLAGLVRVYWDRAWH